jgi:hypothetical protein
MIFYDNKYIIKLKKAKHKASKKMSGKKYNFIVEVDSEDEEDNCECCKRGLPAEKVEGIYVCKCCNNFNCGICGSENDGDIFWCEKEDMCICVACEESKNK